LFADIADGSFTMDAQSMEGMNDDNSDSDSGSSSSDEED